MSPERRDTVQHDPEILRELPQLDVEIEERFDMLAQETERHYDELRRSVCGEGANDVFDVRPQPRTTVRSLTLVGESRRDSKAACNRARASLGLVSVSRVGVDYLAR
jgi:hypothetical protein